MGGLMCRAIFGRAKGRAVGPLRLWARYGCA